MHNPNCDGAHCTSETGQVRRLPTGGGGALILCQACFRHEIRYRRKRNKTLLEHNRFELPEWCCLSPYGIAQQEAYHA